VLSWVLSLCSGFVSSFVRASFHYVRMSVFLHVLFDVFSWFRDFVISFFLCVCLYLCSYVSRYFFLQLDIYVVMYVVRPLFIYVVI